MSFPDGTTLLVLLTGALLVASGWLGYLLLRAAQRLRTEVRRGDEARQELADLQRDSAQFSYIVSHDLQEPVRAMEGFSQLIVRRHQAELSDEVSELMDYVQQGAARARLMISALLQYSRTCSDELEPRTLVVDELLAEVFAARMLREPDRQASYSMDVAPRVRADENQIKKLFAHLIDNALRFSDSTKPLDIRIDAMRTGDEWEFTFADNGMGVPEAELERIFEPFSQLTRSEDDATGMGLTICRQIVARHAGRIRAESGPGHGLCIHFALPAAD